MSPDTAEPRTTVDAEPIAAPAEAAEPVEIPDIPPAYDFASKADVAALAARIDALIWVTVANAAIGLTVLWLLR